MDNQTPQRRIRDQQQLRARDKAAPLPQRRWQPQMALRRHHRRPRLIRYDHDEVGHFANGTVVPGSQANRCSTAFAAIRPLSSIAMSA